jgi:hypothetical protein
VDCARATALPISAETGGTRRVSVSQHWRPNVYKRRFIKETIMKTRLPFLPIAAALLLGSVAAQAEPLPECTMHLMVELTPDVPNPHDPGFLSSLLSDHPQYQLSWGGRLDMSLVALDLSGPGPLDRCEDVVDTMRRDGRVLSVYPEPQDTPTVAVAADREAAEEDRARVSVSPYGFGALYWAALHPSQAWRILLPVQ